jgi:O-antigen/teichoic acid export membrane protein
MGIVQKDGLKITLISYIGAAIGLVNKMLLFPIFLDPTEVGLANLLVSVAVLYASISLLGTTVVMLKYLPGLREKVQKIGQLMWWITLITTAGFLLVTVLLIVFEDPLKAYYSKHSPLLVDYYFYLIPFGAVTMYFFFFDNYLRSLFKTVVPVFFYEVLLRVVIAATVVVYVVGGLHFDQFVLLYLLAHAVPTILILVYAAWLKKLHIRPGKMQFSLAEKKEMFEYGFYAFMNNSSLVLLATLDSVLVAGFLGLDKTGVYTTMFFFVSMLMIPYRAIMKIAAPIISENWQRNDLVAMDKLYKQVTASSAVISCVMFTLMWINMEVAFALMPPIYATGRWALFFLALGRIFDMVTGINGMILITSPRYKVDMMFSGLLIVMLLVSIPGLILLFGMEGAAIGTSLAIVVYNAGRLLYIHKVYDLQPFQWKPMSFLLFAVPLVIANEFFHPDWSLWVITLFKTFLAGAYFLAILRLLRPVDEINKVLDRFSGKLFRRA